MNFMPLRQVKKTSAQRASGRLVLKFMFDQISGTTRVANFFQEGCLKARLPRSQITGVAEAVTLNISGGVAGGDKLATHIALGERAKLCIASQSAEKVYRALDAVPSEIATSIDVGPGALLDYLPQEAIVFNGFALRRRLDIDLAEDAVFLGVESMIFGRQACGESVVAGSLNDVVSLRRAGNLLMQDTTRLDGHIAAILGRKAVADGNIAVANIIYAAEDAPIYLSAVRAVLSGVGCLAGASVVNGVLRARLLAADAASLRQAVMAVLKLCRNNRPLPRVCQG